MSLRIKNYNPHNSNTNKTPICINRKEMPFYASSLGASYTIEAAIIMPLFITLMVFGMFLFRVLQVETGVQQAIDISSRTMAVTLGNELNEGESDKDVEPGENNTLSDEALLGLAIGMSEAEILSKSVPVEFVDGGNAGFNFLESKVEGNYIDLKVNYTMTFPVGLLGDYSFTVSQRARNRKWIGYDKAENTVDSQYVYITDHGEVYHSNCNCTYLRPSVHRIPIENLESSRNNGGAKYYECQRCKNKTAHGFVFLTDYGTAYHNDANCTEIKHNIKKVLYEEVKDTKRPCSKCGKVYE